MKTKLLLCLFMACVMTNFSIAQNSDVQIKVKWTGNSYENKLEVYNTANDLITTICDDTQCYISTQEGVTDSYGSKYDLGCVTNGNNYYIKMYNINNDDWENNSFVSVIVAGNEVINHDGSGASTSGRTIYFDVSGGDATCNSMIDTDSDGVIDNLDMMMMETELQME